MAFPPMMLNSTLPGVVLPLSRPASSPSSSSASTTSSTAYSRPLPHLQTEGGAPGYLANLSMSEAPLSSDNLYQSAHFSLNPPHHSHSLPSLAPHSRHSSNASATSYSLASTGIPSPADSPPSATSTTHSTTSSLKHNLGPIPRTTIRRARTGTSPYPREPHIHSTSDVYSSASETEDLQMYLPPHHHQAHHQQQHPQHHHQLQPQLQPHGHGHPMQDPYGGGNMYSLHPSVAHIDPMQSIQQRPPPLHHSSSGVGVAPGASYGGRMPSSSSADHHNLEQLANNVRSATTTSASDRAKQIFVHAWLNANYTPYADGNVPRQGLYSSYRRVCDQFGIPHMNTATLGKAIRLCFPAIKTRRLGVRGNSKYHYCGIRPSNTAEAEWLQDYIRKTNNANQNNADAPSGVARANSHSSRGSAAGGGDSDEDEDAESPDGGNGPHSANASKRSSLNLDSLKHTPGALPGSASSGVGGTPIVLDEKTPTTSSVLAAAQSVAPSPLSGGSSGLGQSAAIRRSAQPDPVFSGMSSTSQSGAQFNGTGAGATGTSGAAGAGTQGQYSIRQLPAFPNIEEALGNASTSPQVVAAREVWRWFEDHLDALLDSTRQLRFDQFELHLRTFWAGLSGDHREVVHAPAVAGLMAKADALLYDEILEVLRSQILAPIPTPALSSLRGLADQMEKILLLALENYGSTFVEPKVELGARFGHLVLRFLDIYQVTQALATVLQNPKQMADMRRAWAEIDFESVRNQSALVCNCRHEDLIQLLEVDFVALLDGLQRTTEPVRDVMLWADDCCERLMGSNRGEDRSTLSSRSVLIRWGYVTSQIMRDLTIRSDPSFGAFQILKLFLDDWIALNVLRAVALSTNSVAASVEPVIQQQFFSLSPPMAAGTEYAATAGMGGAIMDHTPTNSILAALNESSFTAPDNSFSSSSLDGSSSYVGNSGFGSLDGMNFMDHQNHNGSSTMVGGEGLIGGVSGVDMTFGDPSFDVNSFTQEFVMSATPSDAADPATSSTPAKEEEGSTAAASSAN
ncbi:hypothetical protein CPB86DRAFT_818571 [Serendipita vermifera]|nr:hypothetical protein CPB86DRAFT_818571 [Serendipita vermifera]